MTTDTLPDWAESLETPFDKMRVSVDAEDAYEALLGEYVEFYSDPDNYPDEWLREDGDLRAEWERCLEGLEVENPTAYWLEVAYQSIKLDLQLACRTFNLEIRIHDADKRFSQEAAPDGRDVMEAAGGFEGGKEAREHFRRMRGMLPG